MKFKEDCGHEFQEHLLFLTSSLHKQTRARSHWKNKKLLPNFGKNYETRKTHEINQ
jgi:hypothetical protein